MVNEEISPEQKKKMLKVLNEMRGKMKEIDELAKEISGEEIKLSASPQNSKVMLEEIKVPALELLKDEKEK